MIIKGFILVKLTSNPIFIKLKTWFTPPVFEDENKTLMARNSFSLALVGVATSVFIFTFFLIFSPENRYRLIVIGFSIIFSFLPIVLLHKGHVRAVVYFQVSVLWLGVVSTSISTGGVRSIGFVGGTIAALLVMGIALERTVTFIYIFISIVTAGILAWAEAQGLIDPSQGNENPVILVATYATFLFVLSGLLYVSFSNVTRALEQARRENAERKRAENQRKQVILELEDEIKERQRLQAERENYIQELNIKNAELERFTYTVSHDLKSPIVTIKGFVGLLNKDLQENQPERVQSDLRRIENATEKMNALLKDLLELSRIGRVVNPPMEIDLVQLTREALEMLDGHIRSRNVQVTVSPNLPMIQGDRIRLREVLENLIDNAIKYLGDQADPQIEVGTRMDETEQVIFVKDNGIGIDPAYHERIFSLFEKLNPTSEGTGVGLALVKRIIETHGGRIWVESDGLGKGTAFCFTIPNAMNGQPIGHEKESVTESIWNADSIQDDRLTRNG